MRITKIEVDRFGVWRQLALPVSPRGLTVFYGPNEAGKTTLWRFIRSILYGFEPFEVDLEGGVLQPVRWEGVLQVESETDRYSVHRISDRGTRGLVSVVGTDRQEPAESLLTELLFRTNESLFENVFAVGLNELQELATLEDDEVAHHIYGLTLGPTGQKLLDATRAIGSQSAAMLDSSTRSGRLVDALERDQALREEAEAHRGLREEHADACARRGRVESRIDSLKRRRSQLERQHSGHRLLERVWPAWNQVRTIEEEIADIPVLPQFPHQAEERLERLEAELAAETQCRDQLTQEVAGLRSRRRELVEARGVSKHAAAFAGFVEHAGWHRDVSQQAATARTRAAESQARLEGTLSELGDNWSIGRLERIDTSPAAHRRILAAADRFRTALRRRHRLARRQKLLNRSVRKRAALLDERLKPLGTVTLDQAIAEQTARLSHLDDLKRLRQREAELSRRQQTLTEQAATDGAEMPTWIAKFLAILAGSGLLVTVIGVYQAAAAADLIAGAGLTFIGLTGLGLAWGFKRHQDAQSHADAERVNERQSIAAQIRETKETIAHLDGLTRTDLVDGEVSPATDHEQRVKQVTDRLSELQQWEQSRRSIQSRRKRVSDLRSRFQSRQRALSAERQSWCLSLKENGLPESVKISEALESWHRIAGAREQLREVKAATAEADQLQRQLDSFSTRMQEAARRAGRTVDLATPPSEVLADWSRELESLSGTSENARRAHREFCQQRRKRRQTTRRVQLLRLRRVALFARGGTTRRDEFLERAGWVRRLAECETLLVAARDELRAAGDSEPDLAIVEDDLVQFDADENRERIEALASELEQIERDVHAAFEELGSVKQSLKALESNCEASRLRFDASQTRYELKRTAEEWLGLALARQALDRVRSKFERNSQPATLASASRYLERLTRGRYRNIWTPLGQRELRVDDERGQTLTVDKLSGGTREQMFLAVRMAAVRQLAEQGIELPMVFDDVLVNFDQQRTEAAVETLLEFAEQNQQVLFFTCHLHLAHLFEARGHKPIWLPGQNVPQQERRAG
ncbi:MAG TPA: AAA family ATPase [Planctomycetaceae bacterium]|jgi:uncharacterized protein YhaN|nr:AAA family ATPase [Planctomycetaceae bacterium]